MSIALLGQVYDEMRRLAIAGSVVAAGDFRLKKLVAPLEQAGAKAPVFAKVAEAVKNVTDGPEKNASEALLELTTLVNAILYTQGETGVSGTLQPIETTDLGAAMSQASARVLKPLLEALSTTGSGRLEIIRDAFERGAFRDLRLVKPALEGIDDGYSEVGDFIADNVLWLYGKAIVPELKARLDLKGRGGHPRRLRLMHALDPAGTRETVKEALDSGSKEIKVVAIECLGAEDLSYLIEQANSKVQDVRQAAYRALATMDDEAALAVLQKAMAGKDLVLAADSLRKSRNARLLRFVIEGAKQEIAELKKTKDKKEVTQKIIRLQSLMGCLFGRDDKESEDFVLEVFGQRDELAKIKGDGQSGADFNISVVALMENGTPKLRTTLAEAHAILRTEELPAAFDAARLALPPERVFAMFSPYLTAKMDDKKKKDGPQARRDAIIEAIAGRYHYWTAQHKQAVPLDPRWLDVAVKLENLALVRTLGRRGHAEAETFLSKTFQDVLKKSKNLGDCQEVVASMVYSSHPDATDAFIASFEKHGDKADYYGYWFGSLIQELPKTAVPKLEALIPKIGDKLADSLIGHIQQLRDKKD